MNVLGRMSLAGGTEQTEIARIIPDTRPSALLSAVQNRSRRFCVRRVEELFAFADKVEAQINAAQLRVNNLTQSILVKAFRGELTEQWRKDNPELIYGENSAEALLEKIKVERQSMQGKKTRKKA
jgi:hypothetical protein